MPLPDNNDLKNVPGSIHAISEQMKAKYQSAANDTSWSFQEYFNPVDTLNSNETSNVYGEFVGNVNAGSDLPEVEAA